MINRASQTLDKEVARRLSGTEKAVRDFKNKQFIGGDSVDFVASVENNFSVTVSANSNWWRDLRFTGAVSTAFTSELGLRFYIDNDNDDNYRLPLGPSLSAGQLKCYAASWHDHHEGAVGEKWYHIPLVNGDSSSHVFYGHFILILNRGNVA